LLEKVVTEASDVCSPGLGEGLVPSGEPLTIEIAADDAGNQVLQAVLKGRQRAFRILTVTEADAEINGLSSVELARRWERILQSRVNHARATLTPQRLADRWRLTVVVELTLLGLIACARASPPRRVCCRIFWKPWIGQARSFSSAMPSVDPPSPWTGLI
jgi:small conductance mechanosensitive channel